MLTVLKTQFRINLPSWGSFYAKRVKFSHLYQLPFNILLLVLLLLLLEENIALCCQKLKISDHNSRKSYKQLQQRHAYVSVYVLWCIMWGHEVTQVKKLEVRRHPEEHGSIRCWKPHALFSIFGGFTCRVPMSCPPRYSYTITNGG